MLEVGQLVHIDADHEEWGRLCADGTILEIVEPAMLLVEIPKYRGGAGMTVLVLKSEASARDKDIDGE